MLSLRTVESIKEVAGSRGWTHRTHEPAVTLRFPPSRTTLENAAFVLEHCGAWLAAWKARLPPALRERPAKTYSRLYAVAPYSVAESFTCAVPNAFLIGRGGVVGTAFGELLVESYVDRGATGTKEAVTFARPDFARAPVLSGTYVSLRAYCDHNYTHWLFNCLPRLAMLGEADRAQIAGFITPVSPLKPFHLQSLSLFGLDESKLVQTDEDCVRVERLIICHPTPKTNVPTPAHLLAVTAHLKRELGLASDAEASRRVYVTRRSRTVVNEHELGPVLEEFGFEVVDCEKLSFSEQVRLFAQAKVVLGPHGAGLANHIFCPPGATLIEIYNPLLWHDDIQRSAGHYRHAHWHLHGVPVTDADPQRFDVTVNPNSLRGLLSLACSE